MTEYNIFCYAENYDDDNSFQQKRYRAFNQEVGEKRYTEIKNEVSEILEDFNPNLKDNSWSDEWGKVTKDQWKQLLSIPEAQDFKEGFEFISGLKIDVNQAPKEIKIDGATYILKEIK